MSDPTVTCPNCQQPFKLNETFAAPLLAATRREFAARLAAKDAEAEARIAAERARLAAEETEKARRAVALDLQTRSDHIAELNALLAAREEKLREAQAAQAEMLRRERALEDERRELDLTVQTKVQAELTALREAARREAEHELGLRLREKDEKMASMQRQIEELRRRAESGSQQLQGEAQEIALEARLRERFPQDRIEPVPKGTFGGDIVHRVIGPSGQVCGTLLWESKRTKAWSDGWLAKLRGDQRAANAEIAVIVSQTLPKGIELFDHLDGIWVVEPRCAGAVAVALRQALIELSGARLASAGQQTKAEQVYAYLTGARFRHRIEAIVEKFQAMQGDLDRERIALQRMWAKREFQIRGVLEATVGLYGDLQGIAGQSIQDIDGLALLEAPE